MATHAHLMDDYGVGPDPASAWRLPARYYLDPGVLELEKERIFFRSWLLAGHISQLAEPGSYFTLDLLGERLFFVRGEDDEIRGFYNVPAPGSSAGGGPECYHCGPAHPAFVDLVDMDTYRITRHDMHTTHVMESTNTHNTAYEYESVGAVRQAVFWHVWPNLDFGMIPGSPNFGVFSIDPVRVDLTRTRGVSLRLPTAPTELDRARDRYEAEVLLPEDIGLCESVQRGIASRGYTRGRFMVGDIGDGESEIATHFFQRRISQALEEA